MSRIKEKIISELAKIESDYFEALRRLLQVPSVKGVPKQGAPFGVEAKLGLVTALKIAEELGFETQIVNDAMGYVQFGPDSGDYIGVVGHVDVVPAGDGWKFPPFDLTIDGGKAYGRGVLDNKGSILACLFGLAVLKNLGIPLSKKVRIIFGSDEESGSRDIPLYLQEENPPCFGFTPDCKYPVVYGERGVVGIEIVTSFGSEVLNEISELSGSFERSMIPDQVTIKWKTGRETKVYGNRAPSNAPELGLNAITLLAHTINQEGIAEKKELIDYFSWLEKSLHEKHQGEGLGIDFCDDDSGCLQLSPYALRKKSDQLILEMSIRYPISVTEEEVVSGLGDFLPENSQVKVTRSIPSTVFPKNHPMVALMGKVYEDMTGESGVPVTTTGATYARSMPNIVAFGPSFPGQKGIAHNKDEYMEISDIKMNLKIYALTLWELLK